MRATELEQWTDCTSADCAWMVVVIHALNKAVKRQSVSRNRIHRSAHPESAFDRTSLLQSPSFSQAAHVSFANFFKYLESAAYNHTEPTAV